MKELADWFIQWFGQDPSAWSYTWVVYGGFMLLAGIVTVVFVALFAGPVTVVERRVAGRIMSRVGPNRVGPQGTLQWLADGVKCFLKEDLVPKTSDHILFRLAPYLVFGGFFQAFVVLPFGANLITADLNIGVLYVFAITSLVVVGTLMAGWSSNSKWALFGGIRSAAQMVSYEIPAALGIMPVVLITGSLSTQTIIQSQGGLPWEWNLFANPFMPGAFCLSLVAAIAEGNRTPFDLPEAESELVAGYLTEYSGMRYLFFMFAEWGNLWVIGAVSTICFLGGWNIPFVSATTIAASTGWAFWGWQALSFVVFVGKASALIFVVIQIRWTLPRLRVDQLMVTCWKYFVPLALVTSLGVLCWVWLVPKGAMLELIVRLLLTLAAAAVVVHFFARVRFNYMADRDNYFKMTGQKLWYPPYRLP